MIILRSLPCQLFIFDAVSDACPFWQFVIVDSWFSNFGFSSDWVPLCKKRGLLCALFFGVKNAAQCAVIYTQSVLSSLGSLQAHA